MPLYTFQVLTPKPLCDWLSKKHSLWWHVKTLGRGGGDQTELACTEAFVKIEEFDTRETRSLYRLEMVRILTLRIPHLWLGKQNYLLSLGRKDGILSPRHSVTNTNHTRLSASLCTWKQGIWCFLRMWSYVMWRSMRRGSKDRVASFVLEEASFHVPWLVAVMW